MLVFDLVITIIISTLEEIFTSTAGLGIFAGITLLGWMFCGRIATYGRESYLLAIMGSSCAAIVGAVIWAVITAITQVQVGYMAVGVGFLVGFSVRFFGQGEDELFGFIGAGMSVAGCILGNVFTVIYFASIQRNIPFLDLLFNSSGSQIIAGLQDMFHIMDLLFYAIAVYEGFRFSFSPPKQEKKEVPKQQLV